MENLYQLSEQLKNFEFDINEETGEVLNIDALNYLQLTYNEKAENIIKFIKNLNAEVIAIKSEEQALAERRKHKENKVKWLKDYLSGIMQQNGNDKLEFTSGVASFRKSKSVEVSPEFVEWAKINDKDLLTYKEPTANKTAIKEQLQAGKELPFATIVENKNLGIK